MTGEEAKELMRAIRENQGRLLECPRHRFEDRPSLGMFLSTQRLVCSVCGGGKKVSDIFIYVYGYIAAGGDPSDVAPWWAWAHDRAS